MTTNFRNHYVRPVTAEQLEAVGVDPTDLYWSGTFCCWRFAGATCQRFPYKSTGAILEALGLTAHPDA